MEEEKISGEQLEEVLPNVQSGIVEDNIEGTLLENSDGSLGKFKDAESLLSAYNNLQAEFTRKCQKLSEMSKELEDKNSQLNQIDKKQTEPIYLQESWQDNVSSFLSNNAEAQKYSGDIANEILMDPDLQKSPNALELAWARVMQKNYREPDTLANDQNFITEKILNREEVKKQVLEEYFKNVQKTKTPTIIGSQGSVAVVKQTPPTTMQDAKKMVEKLFNLKG